MDGQPLTRVLLIEDEPDIQLIVRYSLESIAGLIIEVASSGREALQKAPGFAPDLILLDVMMPDMDGPTTLEHLRALPEIADAPVVFLTAKVQPHEVRRYRQLGALEVIAKPFDPLALARRVQEIWGRHTEISPPPAS